MSNLENCPTCKNSLSTAAETCPHCGEPLGAGWADPIIAAREAKEKAAQEARAETLRLEEVKEQRIKEKQEKFKLETKRKDSKRRKVVWTIFLSSVALSFAVSFYGDYSMKKLKAENPVEYQRIMDQRAAQAEARRKAEIEELEKEVATVPVSNSGRNLDLYEALLELDPGNKRYIEKVALYKAAQEAERARRLAAEAEAEKAEREAAARRERCQDDIAAFIMSKTFVERQLKAPSTADFPSSSSATISSPSCGVWEVRSYVDAQNGFGAQIRTQYYVKVQYSGGGSWRLLDIRM